MSRKDVLPTPLPTPARWIRLAWLLALVLSTVSLFKYQRADGKRDYVDDEGIYTYVGWAWGQGDVLYVKSWDHKGPVTFLVTRLRTNIFGTAPEFLVVQETMLGIAAAAAAAGVAVLLWGWLPAAVAASASILLWTSHPPDFGHMSTVGSTIALLNVLALFFALYSETRRPGSPMLLMLAGIAAGLAAWTKPNALSGLFLAALVIISVRRRESWMSVMRRFTYIAAGFALIGAVFIVLLARSNALTEFYDVVVRFNSMRTPILLKSVGLATITYHAMRIAWHMGLAPLLALLMIASALMLVRRSWIQTAFRFEIREIEWVIVVSVILEALTLVSNGSYRHHVYPLLTPSALAAAWLVSIAQRAQVQSRGWLVAAVTLVCVGLPLAGAMTLRPARASLNVRSDDVATWIDANTKPNERLLSFIDPGAPGFLAIAHRRAALRYVYSVPLYLPGYTSEARWEEVLRILSDTSVSSPVLVNDEWVGESADSARARRAMIDRRIDTPWLPKRFVDSTHFAAREELKAILANRFSFVSCRRALCLMRRNGSLTVRESVHAAVSPP